MKRSIDQRERVYVVTYLHRHGTWCDGERVERVFSTRELAAQWAAHLIALNAGPYASTYYNVRIDGEHVR